MKVRSLLIVLLLVLCMGLTLFSCKSSYDSIYLESEGDMRTKYVQGQELDFSATVVKALKKKGVDDISLTDDRVSISGYDKDKLGDQTVTVTLGELTTSFTVTVIPRISVEGVTLDYFKGDSFDKTAGRLRVADDNANVKSVNMSEFSVTVSGFDSSSAGQTTVTVTYGSYSQTFTVNVHNVSAVELSVKPGKTNYGSHETEFIPGKAYFTATSANGEVKKDIPLVAEMVKGFDPSAATSANTNDPLKQTVILSYLGYEFSFDIFIKYSGITMMSDSAKALENASKEALTDEEGQIAISAAEVYYDLSPSEKSLVPVSVKERIMTLAVIYGYAEYLDTMGDFSDTIEFSPRLSVSLGYSAGIALVASSYESAARDLARLDDENEPFVRYATLLSNIEKDFKDIVIADGKKPGEYMQMLYADSSMNQVKKFIRVLVAAYEALMDIPDDWKIEELEAYDSNIRDAVRVFSENDCDPYNSGNLQYVEIFSKASTWRTKNDLYDIVFAYYLEYKPEDITKDIWLVVPLPEQLQLVYVNTLLGREETYKLRYGSDTSIFLYYYFRAHEAAEKVKAENDPIRMKIYNELGFDRDMIDRYLFSGNDEELQHVGYAYHLGPMLENDAVEQFLRDYIDLIVEVVNDGLTSIWDMNFADYPERVAAMSALLNRFLAFSQSEQYGIICLLHFDYRHDNATDYDRLSPCRNEEGQIEARNWFSFMLYQCYEQTVDRSCVDLLEKLMKAVEMNAVRYRDTDTMSRFVSLMAEIESDYLALSGDAKDDFDANFMYILEKCRSILSEYNTPTAEIDENVLAEIKRISGYFFAINRFVYDPEISIKVKDRVKIVGMAAYEYMMAYIADLFESADAEFLKAYYTAEYQFDVYLKEIDGYTESITCTLEYLLSEMRTIYMNNLFLSIYKQSGVNYSYYGFYRESGIEEFLVYALPIMNAAFEEDYSALNASMINEVNAKLDALDKNVIFVFSVLYGANNIYFDGVKGYLEQNLSAELYTAVAAILDAESAYLIHSIHKTDTPDEAFTEAIEAMKTACEGLVDELGDYKDMYLQLLERYENAIS